METCPGPEGHAASAILFVSHKLEELFELCDRVTVMRDGEYIEHRATSADLTDNDSLITAMVGRTLDNQYPEGNRRQER